MNGVLTLREALREADKRNLDLIEISNSGMPICIIADYEKYLYDKKKKAKDDVRRVAIIIERKPFLSYTSPKTMALIASINIAKE